MNEGQLCAILRNLDLILYLPLAELNWKPVGKGVLEIWFVGVSTWKKKKKDGNGTESK